MNSSLIKFCEVERRALMLYDDKHYSKNEMYDMLLKEFGKRYERYILIGIEAAAEANNFHDDSGPWVRDLKEMAGFFTREDLISTRIYIKYE